MKPTAKSSLFVRIRPRKGKPARTYTIRGIKIQEARGWHKVDASLGEYLRGVHSIHGDDSSPLMFDVCTQAEAEATDKSDARAARLRQKATAREPIDATAARRTAKHARETSPDLTQDDLLRGTGRAAAGAAKARAMRPAEENA